jgi:hypothetical protein
VAVFAKGDGEHCSMFRSDEVRNGTSCIAEQPRGYAMRFHPSPEQRSPAILTFLTIL